MNCELDEGMAVLFHSIDRMIAQKSYEGKRWYHALIIDCGGGTTDLTSGRFCIDNNRVSYIVSLETRYENGDTNFGGNNLTYRILQLLKIRIAQVLGCLPDDIFPVQRNRLSGKWMRHTGRRKPISRHSLKAMRRRAGNSTFCEKQLLLPV